MIIDAETALFLCDLNQEIFIEIPQGLGASRKASLSLNKTMHEVFLILRQF
jgi:hypothetical protein